MRKKGLKSAFLIVMIIICTAGCIFSAYKIIFWKHSDIENTNIQKNLVENIIIIEENSTNETEEIKYEIDFESLKKQNSDTVAYLKVNNTKIDYVVVKAKDNKYYLTHNFKKKGNAAGWVFADYHNKFDGKDRNIVIYGHNMKNGSMFGTLKKTMTKKWYKNIDNQIVTLSTPEGTLKYQVFSVYSIPVEEYYINTIFKNDDDFYKFIKKLKSRSVYNFNVSLEKTDKILTLSTCNSGGKNRTVLHAKLVD